MHFYRDGLGLATEGIIGNGFEYGAVVFIDLQAGLRLALWPRKSIAHDSGLALGKMNPTEFTLGHNVSSRGEVGAPRDIHAVRERLLRLGYAASEIMQREYGQTEFFVTDDDGYSHCFGVATTPGVDLPHRARLGG